MNNIQQNKYQNENLNFNKKSEEIQRKGTQNHTGFHSNDYISNGISYTCSILQKNLPEEGQDNGSYLERKLNEINATDPYANYEPHKSKQRQIKENQNQNQFNSIIFKCNAISQDFRFSSIQQSYLNKNKYEINALEPYLDLANIQNHSLKQNETNVVSKNYEEKIVFPKENELNEALFGSDICEMPEQKKQNEKHELSTYLFPQNESTDSNKNNEIIKGGNQTIIKTLNFDDEQNPEKSFTCETTIMNTKNNKDLIQENQKKTAEKRKNENRKSEFSKNEKINDTKNSEFNFIKESENRQNQENNEKKTLMFKPKKEPRKLALTVLNSKLRAVERDVFDISSDEKIKKREENKKLNSYLFYLFLLDLFAFFF